MRGGVRSRRRDFARSRSVSGTGPPRGSPADAFRERSPRRDVSQPRLKQHSAAAGHRGSGPLPPRGSPALSRLQRFSPGFAPRSPPRNTRGEPRSRRCPQSQPATSRVAFAPGGRCGGAGCGHPRGIGTPGPVFLMQS